MTQDIHYIKERLDISRFRDKTVLLIGSSGFLGKWFSQVFDDIKTPYIKYDVQDGNDICNPLTQVDRCDFVINCAGIASPEKYMKQPVATLDVSYIGTKNVLDYCNDHDVESVLLFSSSEVYGTPNPDAIPTKEDYVGAIPTMSNRSCYDIGKQVLETLAHIYYNEHKTRVKIVRPFNLYGPHMGLEDNRVLSNWMSNFLKGNSISIYGNGNQTRTLCYAADGIAMMLGALVSGRDGHVYNVGNPSPEVTMIELANIFYTALQTSTNYSIIDYPTYYPSDEPTRRCPNIDKIVSVTDIRPTVTLETGIKRMHDFYK